MNIEEKKNILDLNIAGKIRNKDTAKLYGVSSRQFYRIKTKYIKTGKIESNRGFHIPFMPEEAILLFTNLTIRALEKIKDVLELVCKKTGKKFDTVNKQRKIFSYPSLSYYKPYPNQIVIPIKSEVKYNGGIKFIIDEEKNDVIIEYVSEVEENGEKINGEDNDNYMKLVFFIITIMSKSYFKHVKHRTKTKIDTKEKFEGYYKEFDKYTRENGNIEELKAILINLLDKNNISIASLPPLPQNDNNSLIQSLIFNEEEFNDCYNYSNYFDDIISSPQELTLSPFTSPQLSPLISPRSLARSRSPRTRFDYPREEIIPKELSNCAN